MSEANRRRWVYLACCLVAGGVALAGCRSEEQDRITEFDKGTYLGKQDQQLSEEQVNELKFRARGQRG